ncbi:thioesterase family protein [Ruania zhangjianzhongii]|uniref:thioesterase family protein n=1 Tax=Ruania zhangjianzhongii TaxID=2603206 RepID=UPI00143DF166|nr:thioesterase family protein [Ruania zhangjianzhongii]
MSNSPVPSYFLPAGPDRYTPTEHVEGAWSDREQHVSPLAGLLVHHMESYRQQPGRSDGKALSRVTFDILGPIARAEIALETAVLRPGRSVELMQTTATIEGRPTLTARGWYLSASDTAAVAGTDLPALPDPDTFEPFAMSDTWPGGFVRSVTARSAAAPRPGRATVWVSTDIALVGGEQVGGEQVGGEQVGALAAYIGLIDAANGVAVRQQPTEWLFPNVDLSVHLFRQPVGPWVGLDTTVSFGPAGHGLTSSVLHDVGGPIGTAAQSLLLRER